MSHPIDIVARVKALMICGMSAKAAAFFSEVPCGTVLAWKSGKRCKRIPPDFSIKEKLNALIKCDIEGLRAMEFREQLSQNLGSPRASVRNETAGGVCHLEPCGPTESKTSLQESEGGRKEAWD